MWKKVSAGGTARQGWLGPSKWEKPAPIWKKRTPKPIQHKVLHGTEALYGTEALSSNGSC